MFIFISLLLVAGYFAYLTLEAKEAKVIESLEKQLGKYISSFELNSCRISGKDWQGWGLKLYLFNTGVAISNPAEQGKVLPLSFNDIKKLEGNGPELTLYSRLQGKYLPQKIELSTSLFGTGLTSIVNQAFINN